jgi:acyl transferase domain-containing protein
MANEPIAIVAIGCQLPGGVHDVASYWRLFADGVDAIDEVPADQDAGFEVATLAGS